MSKRRMIGDRVWIPPGVSFGQPGPMGAWATIIEWPSNKSAELFLCLRFCEDALCVEWNDLVTDDEMPLYHISECQMFDEPQSK